MLVIAGEVRRGQAAARGDTAGKGNGDVDGMKAIIACWKTGQCLTGRVVEVAGVVGERQGGKGDMVISCPASQVAH